MLRPSGAVPGGGETIDGRPLDVDPLAIEDEDQRIGKIRVRFLDATTNGSSNNNDSSDLASVIASNGFDFL